MPNIFVLLLLWLKMNSFSFVHRPTYLFNTVTDRKTEKLVLRKRCMKGMFWLTEGQKYSFISFHTMNFFIGSSEEIECHVARKLMSVILIGSNRSMCNIYFVWFHNKMGTLENTFFSYVTLLQAIYYRHSSRFCNMMFVRVHHELYSCIR